MLDKGHIVGLTKVSLCALLGGEETSFRTCPRVEVVSVSDSGTVPDAPGHTVDYDSGKIGEWDERRETREG